MRTFVSVCVAIAFVAPLVGCEEKTEDQETEATEDVEEAPQKEEKAQPVEPDADEPATVGLVTVESDRGVEDVVDELTAQIEDSEQLSMVATANHAEYLEFENSDEELTATELFVFSNPKLEMPLVEEAVTTGFDLPQRVLIWEDDGTTRVSFNAPAYVAKRHGIERLDLFLSQLESALGGVVEEASGTSVEEMPSREEIGIEAGQGIVTRESSNGVGTTVTALTDYIEETDELNLVAEFDYQEQAEQEGREVQPASLVLFSHPELDAPFLQGARTTGLDIPHPMLVYENRRGSILVAFNDPSYLQMRHGLELDDEALEEMDSMLKQVVAKATKEQ